MYSFSGHGFAIKEPGAYTASFSKYKVQTERKSVFLFVTCNEKI